MTDGDEVRCLLSDVQHWLDRIEELMLFPGWAEGVANPVEDTGFVFTGLSADLVKLPVDISVGDDTPLVIACPRDLDVETIAAIRHWVVCHQDVLADHWRGRISSDELISLLTNNG